MLGNSSVSAAVALLILSACTASAWSDIAPGIFTDPENNDRNSLYYHTFFDLPMSATSIDSLTALHLPRAHPMDEGIECERSYIYFTGKIEGIEPISPARFPQLYESNSDRPKLAYYRYSVVQIELTEILSGLHPGDKVEALTMVRTVDDPEPWRWKSPIVHAGAEIAGLLLCNLGPDLGAPLLHGSSVFVFSSPENVNRLDDIREEVIDLFKRSAAEMEAAQ